MSEYTKPKLRERLKEEIQAGDKGGKPGQWSARKAQLLVQEYERQGGGYTDDERSDKQRHLEDWGEQDWKGDDRYLPEVAWKLLTKSEQEATRKPKQDAKQQFVENTDAAKEARKAAELLTMSAGDAVKAVRKMEGKSQLKRARKAEDKHGKGRKTVLEAIDRRLVS